MSSKRGSDTASTAAPQNQQSSVSEDDIALAELYRDAVIDHAVQPVGYQQDIAATHRCEMHNPLCGDRVEIQFRIADNLIEAAAFTGESCAICMASASMLCEAMPGKSTVDVRQQHALLQAALKDKQSKPGLDSLVALLAIRRYPARIRCALLPWEAAVKALAGEIDSGSP